MEKALILGEVAYSFPGDMLEKLRGIDGVSDAGFIYGPYDFYAIAETKTKEELWEGMNSHICLQAQFFYIVKILFFSLTG